MNSKGNVTLQHKTLDKMSGAYVIITIDNAEDTDIHKVNIQAMELDSILYHNVKANSKGVKQAEARLKLKGSEKNLMFRFVSPTHKNTVFVTDKVGNTATITNEKAVLKLGEEETEVLKKEVELAA